MKSLSKNSREWLILIGALFGILIICLIAFYTAPESPCLDCSSAEAYAYSRGRIMRSVFPSQEPSGAPLCAKEEERKQIVRLLYSRSHVDNVQFHGWNAEKLSRYAKAYAQ